MPTTTLKERLTLAMQGPPEITAAELARACGVKPPSVSDWLTGKTLTLRGTSLAKASKKLNVTPIWLSTGEGPMRPGTAQLQQSQTARLDVSMVAETARALRIHAERHGRTFDLGTEEGAALFVHWYAIREVLPDVAALDNVIELDSRRDRAQAMGVQGDQREESVSASGTHGRKRAHKGTTGKR